MSLQTFQQGVCEAADLRARGEEGGDLLGLALLESFSACALFLLPAAGGVPTGDRKGKGGSSASSSVSTESTQVAETLASLSSLLSTRCSVSAGLFDPKKQTVTQGSRVVLACARSCMRMLQGEQEPQTRSPAALASHLVQALTFHSQWRLIHKHRDGEAEGVEKMKNDKIEEEGESVILADVARLCGDFATDARDSVVETCAYAFCQELSSRAPHVSVSPAVIDAALSVLATLSAPLSEREGEVRDFLVTCNCTPPYPFRSNLTNHQSSLNIS
jgi:hypothetical protein